MLATLVGSALPAGAQGLRFIRDSEIEELLNDYARPIFEAAGLGQHRIRMRIVRDKGFNAFVLDGRNVFVNSGTLMETETPNEVVGVIAHETGHIAGGHMAGLRSKIAKDMTRNLLMKVLGIGAMIAGGAAGKGDTGDLVADAGRSILSGSDELTMRSVLSYRRVQESSADQAAVSYLNQTHQSGRGMLATFERFAQQELFSDRFKDPYVRSHPSGQDRISQLRELAERSPYYSVADTTELQMRHDLMRAKLFGFLEKSNTVLNRYPQSDQSVAAVYARSIAIFNAKGVEAALPLIDSLIAAQPNYAYFWELKGDLLLRTGAAKQAVAPLRKAHQLAPKASLISMRLADALIGAGDKKLTEEAIDLLRRALVEEDFAQGYRQLANAYYQRGEEGLAYLATAQAALLEGKLPEAKGFAKRAQPAFKSGSPNWIKADDIINLQTPS